MASFCPGSIGIKGTPTIKIKICPECGKEIEIFSNCMTTSCVNCGFTVYNDAMSCVNWCKYAKDCVGEELYALFTAKKPDDD
jgi:transposase